MRIVRTILSFLAIVAAPAHGWGQGGPACPTMENPPVGVALPQIIFGERAYEQTSVVWIETTSASGSTSLCTSTIIGANQVLTAAHCVCRNCKTKVGLGPKLQGPTSDKIMTDVVASSLHPLFRPSGPDMQPSSDIAVLSLANYSSCPAYKTRLPIYPVSSAASGPSGQFAVVGYGLTENETFGEKRMANVAAISVTCTQSWARRSGCVRFTEFVLEGLTHDSLSNSNLGADTCKGDSGGPALAFRKGAKFVAGVTSRALVPKGGFNNAGCGIGGIYEYVGTPFVLNWLRSIVPDLQVADK